MFSADQQLVYSWIMCAYNNEPFPFIMPLPRAANSRPLPPPDILEFSTIPIFQFQRYWFRPFPIMFPRFRCRSEVNESFIGTAYDYVENICPNIRKNGWFRCQPCATACANCEPEWKCFLIPRLPTDEWREKPRGGSAFNEGESLRREEGRERAIPEGSR